MNFKSFLAAIRLYWKTFVAVTLAVLALGLAWLWLTPLQYVSTAQLLVSIQGTSTANAYQNDDVVAGRVNSYVALITTDVVSQRVIDKLGLKLTPAQLSTKVSAVSVPNTSIINVAVTESPTGEDAQRVQTTVVSGASQPKSRLVERIALGGLVAALAALVGAVAVWIRSVTDPVIRTAAQAALAAGVPIANEVSANSTSSPNGLEGYRELRAQLRKAEGSGSVHLLQVVPVDDNIPTGGFVANLGRSLALTGSRCAVIDTAADNVPENTDGGLPDFYDGRELAANAAADQPEHLPSALLSQLQNSYDDVIVATPSVESSPVSSTVSDYSDAVLLVAGKSRSRRRDVTKTAARLRATGASVIGIAIITAETAPSTA